MLNVQDKTVWITGASSGIGEALAYQCNAAGAFVVISARRENELARVKSKCAFPEKVAIVTLDQADHTSLKPAFDRALAFTGKIDIFFNNGGISQRAEALKTSLDIDRRIFEINFFSNITLGKWVAQHMVTRKEGHIVVTSSLLGKWGFFLRSGYSATKHALHGFYDSLRMEIEKDGVRISLVTPGFIATEISVHAVDASGKETGNMDANQAGGISPEACAKQVLQKLAKGKDDFGVGGKELLGLKLNRFFPNLFQRILRKQNAQ
jgi:short-subunit dehydrogenase